MGNKWHTGIHCLFASSLRENPNLWSPGQRTGSPLTQRGWTFAVPKETASCSSVRLRERTLECTRCVWRWMTLRTRLKLPFKLLVSKFLILCEMPLKLSYLILNPCLFVRRAARASCHCKDCGYLGFQCCSGVDCTQRQWKHRDHRLHSAESGQKNWSKYSVPKGRLFSGHNS